MTKDDLMGTSTLKERGLLNLSSKEKLMNYYEPREIIGADGKGTGLYHYTQKRDRQIWPVGYCSPWRSCPAGHSAFGDERECVICNGKGLVKVENPCPGHPTKEEASEHYKQYLLEEELRLDGQASNAMYPCTVCGEYTKGFAEMLHGGHWILCDTHRTKEEVAKLFEAPTRSMSSW